MSASVSLLFLLASVVDGEVGSGRLLRFEGDTTRRRSCFLHVCGLFRSYDTGSNKQNVTQSAACGGTYSETISVSERNIPSGREFKSFAPRFL